MSVVSHSTARDSGVATPYVAPESDMDEKKEQLTSIASAYPTEGTDIEKNASETPKDHQVHDIYDRFTPKRKRAIVAIVSFAALLAPFASSSFLPSIPQITHDLHTSQSVINYTVAIYLIVLGSAPLAWSPYSTFYGRQIIYLVSLPIFIGGSIGVAESRTLSQLIVTRIIQGAGSSSVLAVGAGSIGDIYRPTERGRAMGIFYAGAVLGPALAPVVAGIMTEYVHGPRGSWRAFQYLLAGMGAFTWLLMLLVLPETSHKTGLQRLKDEDVKAGRKPRKTTFVFLNPLQAIGLLKYRNILVISLTSSFVLLATYALIVPLTYTLGPRFGIRNEAILGTLYLAQGFGNIVGSRISGFVSDATVKRWIAKRNGKWVPEDRLNASLISGGIITPVVTLAVGFTMQYWTTAAGLAVSLVFLFLSGVGLMGILAVCNTYLVDVAQSRSAEAIAVNNWMRYIFSAGASAAALPLIQVINIAPTNAIATGFTLLGFLLVCLTIRYGQGWRESVDMKKVDDEKSEERP